MPHSVLLVPATPNVVLCSALLYSRQASTRAGITRDATRARDFACPWQLGPVLYEDAPQELRSRLWMALLADPSLTGNLQAERVSAWLCLSVCMSKPYGPEPHQQLQAERVSACHSIKA